MVAVIRSAKPGVFFGIPCPIEFARIDNTAADRRTVTVHILCGGVGYNIRSPLKGTAVYRGCKGIIHNKRNAVGVGGIRELFKIKHRKGGVCDGLSENRLGVGSESGVKLFLCAVGRNKGKINAHSLHCNRKEVICTAVNSGRRYYMVAAGGNIKNRVKGRRLTRRGKHCGCTAL